jgi:hypothetical protein
MKPDDLAEARRGLDPNERTFSECRILVATWLEAERERYRILADSLEIPTSIPIFEQVTLREGEHGASTTHAEQVMVSPVREMIYADQLDQAADDSPPRSPAVPLYNHYGPQCKRWYPFQQFRFETDPRRFIELALLHPLRADYLGALSSLEHADPELAQRKADDLLARSSP